MTSRFAKPLSVAAIALAASLVAQTVAVRAADIGVGVNLELAPGAPPAPRYEAVPPPPAGPPGRVFWVHGRWRWDGNGWAWVPGRYIERPRREARWIEGHWRHRPRGWVWIEGHWS